MEADPQPEPDQQAPAWLGLYDLALETTERVRARLNEHFADVEIVLRPITGGLKSAADRLIAAKTEKGQPLLASDEALIVIFNRLFNEFVALDWLARRGLTGPATGCLRSILENMNIGILFLRRPDLAEPWMRGRQFSPGTVRKLIDASKPERDWYGSLSDLAHANYVATRLSSYSSGDGGTTVNFYGGHFAPRMAVTLSTTALRLLLTLQMAFYAHHAERLDSVGLLFTPDITARFELERPADGRTVSRPEWMFRYLMGIESMLRSAEDAAIALPDDRAEMAQWIQEITASLREHDERP